MNELDDTFIVADMERKGETNVETLFNWAIQGLVLKLNARK